MQLPHRGLLRFSSCDGDGRGNEGLNTAVVNGFDVMSGKQFPFNAIPYRRRHEIKVEKLEIKT
jgi:hypothetical protein